MVCSEGDEISVAPDESPGAGETPELSEVKPSVEDASAVTLRATDET